jgi:hypothetical protein
MNNVEIVIARYNEDLNWLKESPFNEFKYIVYNKGINSNFEKSGVTKIITLPNVGRCDHTYLYHIINNYNSLANITVFFPGSINMVNKKAKAIEILNRIKKNNFNKAIFIGEYTNDLKKKFNDFKLDNWQSSDLNNANLYKDSKLNPSIIRPFGNWFKLHFGKQIINYYTINSIFSIEKRDIMKFKINKYIFLLKQLETHANPEVGHYIERSWGAIFYPLIFTKILIKN